MNNPLVVCALEDEFNIKGSNFDLLYTGVGKVNAAINLTKYIHEIGRPEYIVNYGTAGSKKVKVGSIVDCTKFIQRDMDVSGLGFEKYETPFEENIAKKIDFSTFANNPINCFLTCATGDSFMNSDDSHVGDVVDMESYALAKVCLKFDIPFIAFKYISDSADKDASIDWKENLKKGQKLFKETVLDSLSLF
tara:strand:- start:662 stop:1237 length:576 start_codon:yes stop_codon:yes gene_type:complete